MPSKQTYTNRFSLLKYALILLFAGTQVAGGRVQAQEATITLSFQQTDSTKTLVAIVKSDSGLVAGPEVHLYVKRLFGLLPVGKVVAADENGEAAIEFPTDLPGDKDGMIDLIAKIEGDEKYGDAETEGRVKWGAFPKIENDHWSSRSLSASREKAPMTLVVVSIAIIVVIWSTIFYLMYQLVRIKKAGKIKVSTT